MLEWHTEPDGYIVRCEVFTALTMKNAVFWDVEPCGSCKKDFSEETVGSSFRAKIISQDPHDATSEKAASFVKYFILDLYMSRPNVQDRNELLTGILLQA
jgi:hypothetical protein